MTVRTDAADAPAPGPSPCWCCGAVDAPDRLVHLGHHPEVAACVRCAYSLRDRARKIEDRALSGVAVGVRATSRRLRETVVRHGWHQNKVVGRALRRIGRCAP